MHKYTKTLTLILAFFMGVSLAKSQDLTPKLPKLVAKDQYEKTLKSYVNWSNNLSNPKFYEQYKWTIKEGEKKFPDLTDFEKDQVYLIQGFRLERELFSLKLAWDNEIAWLKSGRINPESIPENAATVEEIEGFQKQLLELRKETAVKFEKLMGELFEKHKDKIPLKEREYVSSQIKKWHDKYNLIERKK